MATSHITIDIERMPELLHAMVTRIAAMVREEAEAEADPRVARRLRAVAARFEAGQ